MQRLIRACALALLLAPCVLAHAEGYYLGRLRLALIDDPVRIEFQNGSAVPTPDTLQQAIKAGVAAQGWKVVNPADGRMELMRIVRNEHTMVIEVTYDSTGYGIRYLQSTNLMYSEQGAKGKNLRVIHGNYNEWINDLGLAINGNADADDHGLCAGRQGRGRSVSPRQRAQRLQGISRHGDTARVCDRTQRVLGTGHAENG
jgi:hypothetical protein